MTGRLLFISTAAAAALVISGCAPSTHSHGYTPRAEELSDIAVGTDTRESIQRKLGRPSTISTFDDDDWYYVSVRTETFAFYAPEVVDQSVVAVSFGDDGTVVDINRYGIEDGQVIDLVSRTTPTSGRELTVLQQIFANIGRFNTEDALGSSGPTGVGRGPSGL